MPTATAAVLVFGAVETGGFALFPVYGSRIGYSEADAALLLTMIGLGNVILQIPLGMVSDRVGDRRHLLLGCAVVGLLGTILMPFVAGNWHLMAALLFVWGGVVAALYTIGLAHLGTRLSGQRPRLGQRRLRALLRRRHGARPAGDRHRHGRVRQRRLRLVAGAVLRGLYRAGAGAGSLPKRAPALTFGRCSLCVAPSFPRPGSMPASRRLELQTILRT